MTLRLKNLEKTLNDGTVLEDWFLPAQQALESVRYSDKIFPTLKMNTFIQQNCVRQINDSVILREHLQFLFHLDDERSTPPLARSTYSDALASKKRLNIVSQVVLALAKHARETLPDRLAGLKGIGNRSIYALDATYQIESSHFSKLTPSQGGTDSSKGHMELVTFDLRAGIPINVDVDTSSIAEVRFVKERWDYCDLTSERNSLWVVDRAFIDSNYWDARRRQGVTVITRMKENLNFSIMEDLKVTASNKKQGVVTDQIIELDSSSERWRLIGYRSDSGEYYEYLTNDFNLEPGIIAFLYHRRWDEEKYFDNYKNDMGNQKAWGKNSIAIKQQALIGIITFILTRLFTNRYGIIFNIPTDGNTQSKRHLKKQEKHLYGETKDHFKAFHVNLSKVTRQVWRFLKMCMLKKCHQRLYQTQLKPLMTAYL